jgi:tRNA-dihydrouridine synthase
MDDVAIMGPTFWDVLPRPIIGLAPMHGITDHPFRHIQKKYGAPMLLYTEFTGVDRIIFGDAALLEDLLYDESQRPIIAQIFGQTPGLFRRMAVLLCQLGFDGIDINMGCPAETVVQRGSGAGLIKSPVLAQAIIDAAKAGVADWCNGASVRDDAVMPPALVAQVEARQRALPAAAQRRRPVPISVKTRIGYGAPQVQEWIPYLLDCEPAAIVIHGRTLEQGYTGKADWAQIAAAAELAQGSNTLILGNGDVKTRESAQQRAAFYGLDGVLIGRASYGNPFVFQPGQAEEPSLSERYRMLQVALEHARLFQTAISGPSRNRFMHMRKHLSWYVRGVPGAAGLRRDLINVFSPQEVETIFNRYLVYRHGWDSQIDTNLLVNEL